MRVTVSVPKAMRHELDAISNKIGDAHCKVEASNTGETANFDGDPLAFLTMAVQVVRDIGIGLFAAYLYDLRKRPNHRITIEGKSIDNLTVKEIEVIIKKGMTE